MVYCQDCEDLINSERMMIKDCMKCKGTDKTNHCILYQEKKKV